MVINKLHLWVDYQKITSLISDNVTVILLVNQSDTSQLGVSVRCLINAEEAS